MPVLPGADTAFRVEAIRPDEVSMIKVVPRSGHGVSGGELTELSRDGGLPLGVSGGVGKLVEIGESTAISDIMKSQCSRMLRFARLLRNALFAYGVSSSTVCGAFEVR